MNTLGSLLQLLVGLFIDGIWIYFLWLEASQGKYGMLALVVIGGWWVMSTWAAMTYDEHPYSDQWSSATHFFFLPLYIIVSPLDDIQEDIFPVCGFRWEYLLAFPISIYFWVELIILNIQFRKKPQD